MKTNFELENQLIEQLENIKRIKSKVNLRIDDFKNDISNVFAKKFKFEVIKSDFISNIPNIVYETFNKQYSIRQIEDEDMNIMFEFAIKLPRERFKTLESSTNWIKKVSDKWKKYNPINNSSLHINPYAMKRDKYSGNDKFNLVHINIRVPINSF